VVVRRAHRHLGDDHPGVPIGTGGHAAAPSQLDTAVPHHHGVSGEAVAQHHSKAPMSTLGRRLTDGGQIGATVPMIGLMKH
jgi:hypothetical protein